eukprot:c28241_g1_i1 orf=421-2349(+)
MDANLSFCSMLEEIFQQTQSEIDKCRAYSPSGSSVLTLPKDKDVDVVDETQRFEPIVDPAISYISNILEQEEDSKPEQPCMTLDEYLAYQATAQEVAALLKEDSPALSLKLEAENPVSPDAGSTSQSEDSGVQRQLFSRNVDMTEIVSSGPIALSCAANSFLGISVNDMPVVGWSGSPYVDTMEQNYNPERRGPNCEKKIESKDDIGVRSNSHRDHRINKKDKVLKPRKESTGSRKKTAGKTRSSKEGEQEFVDLDDLLLQSAQAVGVNNVKRAVEILKKVKQHASPYGNGAERLAYYFAEGLDARFSGTGWPLYLGLLRRKPSPAEVLRATTLYMASCPFSKVSHYFINQTILDVAKGATMLHIMDLQIAGGFNYPSLIKALAERPGGPPFVRVIGIEFPHYSMMPARTETILEGVDKTGHRLADYAANYGVPFEFTAWAGTREDLEMQNFVCRDRDKDEVLVIISAYMLRYVMDDTLDSPNARLRLLKMGQSINPNIYIQGIVTGAYNTPYFTRRFREALFHFESLFDVLDTFVERENQDRIVFESEILGKAILNIVACEGMEVVERIDKYKHWQAISEEVGFEQLPLNEDIKQNVQAMLKSWHKEYTVTEDSQYMLMGWKGRMLHAMSTWKSSALHIKF